MVGSQLMSISAALPRYRPLSTMIWKEKFVPSVQRRCGREFMRLLKMRTGWKQNGKLGLSRFFVFFFFISLFWILNEENVRFKLHLRSKVGAGRHVTNEIPPLPLNKTVVEVFADFLRYLLECASSYIQDTHANGPDLWISVQDQIDFVLSHPNGWEGTQQSEMRRAAVLADLIPDTPAGHARLSFVTEGEASLHFSIQNGLPAGAIKVG